MVDIFDDRFAGECPATFFNKAAYTGAGGKGTSRIDTMLTNWPAALMVNACSLQFTASTGQDHVPLEVQVNTRAYDQEIDIPTLPRHINMNSMDGAKEDHRKKKLG